MLWNRYGRFTGVCSLLLIVGMLGLTGCEKGSADDVAPKGAPGGKSASHGPGPGGHGGPKGQTKQAIPVAVTDVTSGSISSYYQATATLEAEKQAQVLARVNGVVLEILTEEGETIQAGAPLLRIGNDEYRFRVEQTSAATDNLRSRYERLEKMLAQELATEEEIQSARSDLASAEADEGLARLNFSYTTVRAPFSGLVTQRLIDVGQNISNNDPLFVMADFEPLLARVHVPSREFKLLQQNQAVELVLDSNGIRLIGYIKLISPIIDPTSGTIKITVEISEYPAGTRPGEFAQVHIVTEKREGSTLVPRGAVLSDKGESVVYVPVEEGGKQTAERRIVEVGFTDDEHVQIISGLQPGDTVIIKGQRSLKHGAALKIIERSGN